MGLHDAGASLFFRKAQSMPGEDLPGSAHHGKKRPPLLNGSEFPDVFTARSLLQKQQEPPRSNPFDPQELSRGFDPLPESEEHLLDYLQTSLHRKLPTKFKPKALTRYASLFHSMKHLSTKELPLGKQFDRLAQCHADWLVLRKNSDDSLAARPYCCGVRLCPLCSGYRGSKARLSIEDKVDRMRNRMLWTFTIRSTEERLDTLHKKLTGWFARLRRTEIWKHYTRGCVWVFEFTLNIQTDKWHPHLHVIVDTRFLPFHALQDSWRKITGGSHSINFRGSRGTVDATNYIVKYITKPASASRWSIWRLAEFLCVMRGKRLYGSTGTAFGLSDGEKLRRQCGEGFTILGWLSKPTAWEDDVPGGRAAIKALIHEIALQNGVDAWSLSFLPP